MKSEHVGLVKQKILRPNLEARLCLKDKENVESAKNSKRPWTKRKEQTGGRDVTEAKGRLKSNQWI